LAPVQTFLETLTADTESSGTGLLMEEFGVLLYAGYHYWSAGRRTVDVTLEDLDREATGTATRLGTEQLPEACYVRLPERRIWAQIHPEAPHEPMDGLFAVIAANGAEMTVVAVLGVRADRAGFSQIAVTVSRGDLIAAAQAIRYPLFAPVMEGGERAGFRSIATEGELLHLARLSLSAAFHGSGEGRRWPTRTTPG
jgi:hypothetical protein